ncbi:putative RNA-directed DNA polymerase [Helianthus annuus]|nr:putative RNA-directed DNA polymerase [Helianthus annuus]
MAEQQAIILLNASLTEEALSVTIGKNSAREIWLALENAFCNMSVERVQNLRDNLRLIQRGDKSVADYGRAFKAICDQLNAIGHPVDPMDQFHWFLCGLGTAFEGFSIHIRTVRPIPNLTDLIASAESHDLFVKALHGPSSHSVAYSAQTYQPRSQATRFNNNRPNRPAGNMYRNSSRNNSPNRGPPKQYASTGSRPKRPPTCQLCRRQGHYATQCHQLTSFASSVTPSEAQLAQAFHAHCQLNASTPDWTSDTGASDHMVPNNFTLPLSTPTHGKKRVFFGNGQSLPITHVGNTKLFGKLDLKNVLVVPNLTKNLLSISKLTEDNLVDVVFSYPHFFIQDRLTKQIIARGSREDGLYVLHNTHQALVSNSSCPKASFELWHSRLGHVNFDIINMLKNNGLISFTSVLPKPGVCSPCELAKSKRLPFSINNKRASSPLELIHCDLWGPSPVKSNGHFTYYVAFVDDFSRFTWLYPLRAKSEFFDALSIFFLLSKPNLQQKLKRFKAMAVRSSQIIRYVIYLNKMVPCIVCPVHTPRNKMLGLKENIVISLKLV